MKFKKLIAALLSAVIIVTGLAFGFVNAYAETITLEDTSYNKDIVATNKGYDDKIWYVFTPSQSGIYTLYGLLKNTYVTEGYLFTKTVNEFGQRVYNQLSYSKSNPNASQYEGAGQSQFCLKYHLEAGKTYYYAAGFYFPDKTKNELTVRFLCESYDSAELVSITPHCKAELSWYTDGEWKTDSEGNAYYSYSISKIIQNMSLTLLFDDGTTLTSSPGDLDVEGYPIGYSHNQAETHWYSVNDENYTSNKLTISVLNKSVDYEVVINESALFSVKGKVVDYYDNSPVANAKIKVSNAVVATTDSNGVFSFAYSPGKLNLSVSGGSVLERSFSLTVDINDTNNDHTSSPVKVVNVDYVNDGIINGRDLAYIKSSLASSAQTKAKKVFAAKTGFAKSDYPKLDL